MDAFEIMCIVIMAIGASIMFWNLCGLIAVRFKQKAYWQQYRTQASIAAMQGMLANPQTFEQIDHDERYKEIRGDDKVQLVAMASVMYADVLIEELQKKEGGGDADV